MKIYIGLGIIIFLFLPFGIDRFFMNKFITNWNVGQWAGFLGSYLGGAIGGIIAIGGIWWQLRRSDEKEKIEKVQSFFNETLFFLNLNQKSLNALEYDGIFFNHFYKEDYIQSENFFQGIDREFYKENKSKIFVLPFSEFFIKFILEILELRNILIKLQNLEIDTQLLIKYKTINEKVEEVIKISKEIKNENTTEMSLIKEKYLQKLQDLKFHIKLQEIALMGTFIAEISNEEKRIKKKMEETSELYKKKLEIKTDELNKNGINKQIGEIELSKIVETYHIEIGHVKMEGDKSIDIIKENFNLMSENLNKIYLKIDEIEKGIKNYEKIYMNLENRSNELKSRIIEYCKREKIKLENQ